MKALSVKWPVSSPTASSRSRSARGARTCAAPCSCTRCTREPGRCVSYGFAEGLWDRYLQGIS